MGQYEPMQKIYCRATGEWVGSNPKHTIENGVKRVRFYNSKSQRYEAIKLYIFELRYRVEVGE